MPYVKGSQEAKQHMDKIRGKCLTKGSEEAKQHMKELRDKIKKNKDNKTN